MGFFVFLYLLLMSGGQHWEVSVDTSLYVFGRYHALLYDSSRDFPGEPVVKTPCFHYRGLGFDPWLRN